MRPECSRPFENVEISVSGARAALVVSMHCLVLYCYLLASTKRGNESERGAVASVRGVRVRPVAGWAVIIILPHFDLDRLGGRGHTQTQRLRRCRAARGSILAAMLLSSSSAAAAAADAFRSLDKWPLEAN